ncbi:flagellar hook-associated protein FlgL [Geodermatophilus sp. YIM 151500]|uniref:flagellar hook-associated protein FlgL n=1 Tax=Geodermatophilus sp. YIM 151500 TaxID=2984531 RepID=UPI0021E42D0D|nr:flagellar hook-associated protein FlgL [Geodermatophilus sp. YIM 151500]MCV2489480.1 flagellar hook-associated protein FlgL [Geodermatophilus sp. YIM 151500]
MRITQRAVALTSLQGLNRNLDAVGRLQEQLSSGRLVSAPSDSPTAANRAMQTRSDQAAVAQFDRNITDASSWLERTDTVLQTMLDTTRRVRDLTVQGLNTGATSAASQEALATEVASLREGLVALANTRLQGRPIFGGITSGDRAYTDAGTWTGEAGGDVLRRISDDEVLAVDVDGLTAFGSAPADLFTVVGDIVADLTGDPAGLEADLAALDEVMKGMSSALADVGARASRLERAAQVNSDRALTLGSQLAEVENIDLPETVMRLQMQQVGYEAALAATAKALQPTLLDFLR